MKRFLFLLLTCLCAVTGAWATDATITGGSDSRVIITTNDEPDLTSLALSTYFTDNWGCNTLPDNGVQVSGTITQSGLNVIETMMGKNTAMYYNPNKLLDLSTATFSGTITSLPSGVSTSEYPTQTKFTTCILPNGSEIPTTVPDGYTYVYSGCESGGTIRIYVKSGTTSVPQLTSAQIEAASQIVITGSGKDAYIATLSDAAKEKLPFDGSIAITTTSSDDVQAKVEAYLINKGLISNESTAEEKAAVLAQITSLTIAGPLTSADITYLSNLTSLEILDLTQVSSFGAGVSKSTINAAVASGATVTYPPLLYSSADGVTTITIFDAGNATTEVLAAKISGTISDARVVIKGEANATDISNIIAKFYGWAVKTLDLSGLTVYPSTMPRLSTVNNSYDVVILPAGFSSVSEEDMYYDSAHDNDATHNGIYNICNDLDYVIIPAASEGGSAKIYVNKSKATPTVVSEISSDDIAVINANNPAYIDVYNRNNSFDESNFSYLETSINTTWGSTKTVRFHRSSSPIIVSGCDVIINMTEGNGQSLETLVNSAYDRVTDGTSYSNICTIKIEDALTSTDITYLNTAMGSSGKLAEITGLDLGSATGMSQANVNNLAIPTSLERLVIPSNMVVDGNLVTAAEACDNLYYIYSPSSDAQRLGADKESQYDGTKNYSPDYAWIVKQGGLATAFANEEPLRNSFYIKVASSVALTSTDVDFDGMGVNKPTNYLFLDFSGSNLTPAVAAQYKVTDDIGYRIILPDNWTGDDMAVFAANEHCGSLAAVYSYNGTVLNIMEIDDLSYNTSALSNPRIMRSGTTEVDVISGFYNGVTYSQFGGNLLAALNQMGDPANTVGPSVKTIVIETGINVPSAITFTNPSVETIKLLGLSTYSGVNVNGCTSLNTLDLKGSAVSSVTASGLSTLTTVDLTTSVIYDAADFSGSGITTLTTTDETTFNGALNLSQTAFTSFTSAARHGGDISFNQCPNLASINVTAADFANTTSKIHIDADAENAENTTILSTLNTDKCIKIPSDFETSRLHPAPASSLVEQASAVAAAVTYTATDMTFHDNNTGDAYYPTYRYWYQGTTDNEGIATLGTSSERRLATIISDNPNLKNNSHAKIKIVGPLTSDDIDALDDLNCTMLDISDATIETGLLKTKIAADDILNANTKFLVLPDSCSREHIVNGTTLANLANVYSVIAVQNTEDGRDLTSWSRVAGALQPAVVGALNNDAQSWSLTPSGQTERRIYTSSVSNFKALKISGCINSYDLSKADQKLDSGGHLSWAEAAVEAMSQTRTQNGAYNVYGPFSACFLLTEIDLKNAYFEPWSNQQTGEGYFTRYWVSDMTLSALNVISTATYKVVIPQDSRVNEVPADFLRCSTNIRAICIPSNIRVIRTRAFYTIDYVWTTSASGLGMEGNDPEGDNTRLDNGAKLKIAEGSDFIETSALIYENGKYKENPAFTKQYYTADYSTVNGGGTYTFGSNLRLIETGAFANTQPHVKDVYVLNTTAPECHVDAFNTVMYTGNGGYSPISGDQKIISRENYFNNGFWITMLHYPRQTTTPNVQRYTDPTREYSIATGERDGKGAIIYYPNQSEFIRAYQQGTYGYIWNAWNPTRTYGSVNNGTLTNTTQGWSAENQSTANELFDAYTTGGTNHQYTSFAGVNDSTSVTKTKTTLVPYFQVQYGSGSYSTAETQGNLYPKSEILAEHDDDNSGEPTAKDYRGWHQFVLNAYAANTILNEEPYRSYITDNEWWTICPTFDITREEAIKLFGTPANWNSGGQEKIPYVSKLRYVRRTYYDQKITLNFSDNLMVYKETRANAADQHGTLDDNGVMNVGSGKDTGTPNSGDVVMSAGVPYLIKPNMTAVNGGFNRQFQVYTDADYENLSAEQKSATSPRAIGSTSLYNKIKAAQEMPGDQQIAIINSGKYTVPVFVSGRNDGTAAGYDVEEVEKDVNDNPKTYTIASSPYEKSTTWKYTFVGSFYKSFLPHYCYYLGWDSSLNSGNGGARFFYLDGEKGNPGVFTYYDNNMNWNNETGVICPTKGDFSYTVTPASGMLPATWIIGAEGSMRTSGTAANNNFLPIDSYVMTGGSGAKAYEMLFGAPDVIAVNDEVTGISNIDANNSLDANSNADVYTINGQKVGTSLVGLPKGIYIVNGKKFIVK